MKWILTLSACAAMIAFAGCKPSNTQTGTTPDTNAPAAQIATPEQAVDAAKAAAPAATSDVVTAPASAH